MITKNKGLLISFEGIDGAGKDTQIKLTLNYFINTLNYCDVKVLNFPDYNGFLGKTILMALENNLLNGYALQLLLSSERYRQLPVLTNYLNNGYIVFANRYKWSGYAYGVAGGLSSVWIEYIDSFLPEPNLVFLLDIDVESSIQRTGGKDILEQNKIYLEKCRFEYLKLANINNNCIQINASQPVDFINRIIIEKVLEHINS